MLLCGAGFGHWANWITTSNIFYEPLPSDMRHSCKLTRPTPGSPLMPLGTASFFGAGQNRGTFWDKLLIILCCPQSYTADLSRTRYLYFPCGLLIAIFLVCWGFVLARDNSLHKILGHNIAAKSRREVVKKMYWRFQDDDQIYQPSATWDCNLKKLNYFLVVIKRAWKDGARGDMNRVQYGGWESRMRGVWSGQSR